jgi:very-short-patch-repair endonuclease
MELIDKETLEKVKSSIYEIAEEIKEDKNDLYDKLINNWDTIVRLFLYYDNKYSWPMDKKVFSNKFDIHIETLNTKIRNLRIEGLLTEGKGKDYFIDGRSSTATTDIYETGAQKILERTDSIEGSKYLFKQYGIYRRLRPCFCYISIIRYSLKGIDNPKREYSTINRYKVDLYLLLKKLAIECDERRHDHENIYNKVRRQEAIENKLGCRFMRFNPHPIGRDFDIGKVIKHIFYYILDKKIDGKDPIDHYMENYYMEKRKIITAEELEEFD